MYEFGYLTNWSFYWLEQEIGESWSKDSSKLSFQIDCWSLTFILSVNFWTSRSLYIFCCSLWAYRYWRKLLRNWTMTWIYKILWGQGLFYTLLKVFSSYLNTAVGKTWICPLLFFAALRQLRYEFFPARQLWAKRPYWQTVHPHRSSWHSHCNVRPITYAAVLFVPSWLVQSQRLICRWICFSLLKLFSYNSLQ